MTSAAFLGLCLLSAAIIIVPGACLVSLVHRRPLVVLGAGPAMTLLVVACLTTVLPFTGTAWTWRTGLGLLALVSILAGLLGRRRATRGRGDQEDDAVAPDSLRGVLGRALLAAAPAGVAQFVVVWRAMGRPEAPLQNYDVMFHLNLIAQIRTSGDASMLTASTPLNGGSFYPATFHALAALLLGVVEVPVAFNAVLVSLTAVICPISAVLLARAVGVRWWAGSLAALAATSTMWMPGFMLLYHGQAPAGLSAVLIPCSLAALLHLAVAEGSVRRAARLAPWLVLGLGAGHPGAGQWMLVTVCVLGVLHALGRLRRTGPGGRGLLLACAALLVLPVVGMLVTPQLRTMAAFARERPSVSRSLTAAAILSPQEGNDWLYAPLVALALAGVAWLLHEGRWALPAVWAVAAGLTAATAFPESPVAALTGAWWGDPSRFLSVLVLIVGALTGAGAQVLSRLWAPVMPPWAQTCPRALVVILVSGLALNGIISSSVWARRGFDEDLMVHPPWVSAEEQMLLEGPMRPLFDDATVFGAPQTGAGLIPVLTEGHSINRTVVIAGSEESAYIGQHFNDIATDPRVCEIVRAQGGTPLYYEDPDVDIVEIAWRYPGYFEVDTSEGFKEIAQIDTAVVYRITACD